MTGEILKRFDECTTLSDLLYNGKKYFPHKDYVQYREGSSKKTLTFTEVVDLTESLAASFYKMGIRKGDKITLVSDNMYKWLVTDLALLSLGAADVPRGSDSTALEIEYIAAHSESRGIVAENPVQCDKIVPLLGSLKKIEFIMLLTGDFTECKTSLPANVRPYTFDKLVKEGKQKAVEYKHELQKIRESVTRDDLATIIYTSGTTGNPKGVMLSQGNIMANIRDLIQQLPVTEKDRWLSVLPVWHVFERTLEYWILSTCSLMAYSKPTAKHLLVDFKEVRPTYIASVPRIWESLYNGMMIKLKKSSPLSKVLFSFFLSIGVKVNKAWKTFTGMEAVFEKQPVFKDFFRKLRALIVLIFLFLPDRLGILLVFSKIHKSLGGKLKGPISGGGALPAHIDDFFSAIKIHILEGYGLTETAPVISSRQFDALAAGTVGPILKSVEVMIGDDNFNRLPDQQQKGIIYVKGKSVMAGYYKNQAATDKIIKNAWLNTGDLGRFTINGELQITGRAKDTIVLLGGENIEPAPIELKLIENPFIDQVMIVGQDKKALGALIVPNMEELADYCTQHTIPCGSESEMLKDSRIESLFDTIIKEEISVKNHFKVFEKVKGFKLLSKPFEVGEELTLSLKKKRHVIAEKYQQEIASLYS